MNSSHGENRPIVFYGAGSEAKSRLAAWEGAGLVPACFADGDAGKHYTRLAGYEILPLRVAMERYPDCDVYLTIGRGRLHDATQYLSGQGIPAERIKFADPVEWRKGCDWLGRMVNVGEDVGLCCANKKYRITASRHGMAEQIFSEWFHLCEKHLDNMRNNRPTACDACPHMREDYYSAGPPRPVVLNISSDDNLDYCNFRCSYCRQFSSYDQSRTERRSAEVLSIIRHFSEVCDSETANIELSCGEPAALPMCDEIFNFCFERNLRVAVFTNASIYKESLANLLASEKCHLLVSLDAGTRETFRAIKGRDMFEPVLNNLRKYAIAAGGGISSGELARAGSPRRNAIHLKYIMLETQNDNEKDIGSFLDFAREINAHVVLSNNSNARGNPCSRHTMGMSQLFAKKCAEQGLPLTVGYEFFNPSDAKALRKYMADSNHELQQA
ncbi:MAG: radical SAM protein [Clostridiales bacterium]|jgi:pyruvate-formate lyase-activating enzyme|nr:radical SAM protein [Clostridiales bacterium]